MRGRAPYAEVCTRSRKRGQLGSAEELRWPGTRKVWRNLRWRSSAGSGSSLDRGQGQVKAESRLSQCSKAVAIVRTAWRTKQTAGFIQNTNLVTAILTEESVAAPNEKTYHQERNSKPHERNQPHSPQDEAGTRKVTEGVPNKSPTPTACTRRKPAGAPGNNGWQCKAKNYGSQ